MGCHSGCGAASAARSFFTARFVDRLARGRVITRASAHRGSAIHRHRNDPHRFNRLRHAALRRHAYGPRAALRPSCAHVSTRRPSGPHGAAPCPATPDSLMCPSFLFWRVVSSRLVCLSTSRFLRKIFVPHWMDWCRSSVLPSDVCGWALGEEGCRGRRVEPVPDEAGAQK
jgi:hypothetical protein